LAFVAQHRRDGRAGALQMGIRHGAYCLGCCWALFAVIIAAGMIPGRKVCQIEARCITMT
jgi:predicted metal-binding membrane protein